jgi:predicted RNA-binding protein with PIN domain
MANLTSVLKYLEQERNRVGAQLERLNHALSVLIGTSNRRARRTISAAGRARIAAAQRARWAKSKGQKVVSTLARKGRTMSPAARRRIVAAQKARWAKWRKAHKKA